MDSCITKKEQTREGMARNRREATRQNGNLFFEMSRPVESPEMLKSWVEWFRRLHIPCAIARTEAGYTLWRKGKEVGRRRSKVPYVPTDIVYSFGFTASELNLLKETEQEGVDKRRSRSSEGFEEITHSLCPDCAGEMREETKCLAEQSHKASVAWTK